ncbi:hypothetical protein P5W04_10310 [Mycobacteroides abscessus subsp. abscessus]|uniref:hypothetical protein n=1 Tax=Mycobacteroides abscessus TaxID=36809 RepID=UPI0011C47E6A|nr:hypothetical protein [Mycobacteroides abscessus]MBN7484552.1 hypothetical protein [Mycobacteroides abscessus subsp. abscessus]MDO3240507.1 hypothetical protein [Mycobacteroides abscessus subsp. abscessus]
MSAFPFATAATNSADLADSLNNLIGGIEVYGGQGLAADAINVRIGSVRALTAQLAESALTLSGLCQTQDDADVTLSDAPTRADILDLYREWKRILQDDADDTDARCKLDEATAKREAAVTAHAGESGESATALDGLDIPTIDATSDVPYTSVPRAAGGTEEEEDPQGKPKSDNNPAPSDSDTSPSSSAVSDSAAPTALSSDGGTATSTPSLSAPASATPTYQSATPQGGTPTYQSTPATPQGMQNTNPNASTSRGSRPQVPNLSTYDRDRKRRDRDRDREQLDNAVPVTLPGGDQSPTMRGVTTAGQTSGAGTTAPTALSSNGVNPQQQNTNPNGPNPRGGGMGPMMGSGMGLGSGGQTKTRDTTPAGVQDKNLLGYQSVHDSVQGGSIGRDSSSPDPFTRWSGSIELLDDRGKGTK